MRLTTLVLLTFQAVLRKLISFGSVGTNPQPCHLGKCSPVEPNPQPAHCISQADLYMGTVHKAGIVKQACRGRDKRIRDKGHLQLHSKFKASLEYLRPPSQKQQQKAGLTAYCGVVIHQFMMVTSSEKYVIMQLSLWKHQAVTR